MLHVTQHLYITYNITKHKMRKTIVTSIGINPEHYAKLKSEHINISKLFEELLETWVNGKLSDTDDKLKYQMETIRKDITTLELKHEVLKNQLDKRKRAKRLEEIRLIREEEDKWKTPF